MQVFRNATLLRSPVQESQHRFSHAIANHNPHILTPPSWASTAWPAPYPTGPPVPRAKPRPRMIRDFTVPIDIAIPRQFRRSSDLRYPAKPRPREIPDLPWRAPPISKCFSPSKVYSKGVRWNREPSGNALLRSDRQTDLPAAMPEEPAALIMRLVYCDAINPGLQAALAAEIITQRDFQENFLPRRWHRLDRSTSAAPGCIPAVGTGRAGSRRLVRNRLAGRQPVPGPPIFELDARELSR